MKLNPKPMAEIDNDGCLVIYRELSDIDSPIQENQWCPFSNEEKCGIHCPLLKINQNEIILGCASGVYWKREKENNE